MRRGIDGAVLVWAALRERVEEAIGIRLAPIRFETDSQLIEAVPPQGPVIRVAVDRWSGWAFVPHAT